jgi:hypothetical protein
MARWAPRDPHQFVCGSIAGIGLATLGVLAWPSIKRLFNGPEIKTKRLMGDTVEERCVLHVFKAAHKGDAASVIKAIDEFCWKEVCFDAQIDAAGSANLILALVPGGSRYHGQPLVSTIACRVL